MARSQTNLSQGFQEGAWQWLEPGQGFQPNAFHGYPAFQAEEPTGVFQPQAFDDEGFQTDLEGFQDTGFESQAFQIDEPLLPVVVVEPARQSLVVSRQKSDRFFRARQHRQAKILRAPQPAPVVSAVPRPAIIVEQNRRTALVARRRHKPVILRSRVFDSPRARVQVHERSRSPLLARRKRKPPLLRAPLAAAAPKYRLSVHERARPTRLRRRKPTLLRAPLVAAPVRAISQHRLSRSALLKRTRRAKPILLRGVSTPTPAPSTGIPVKRIFVYEDRRAAFIKARRRSKQILRAPSVPTPVPLVRQHVLVSKRRLPLQARARHKPRLLRGFVAPVRPPVQLVRKQRRRLQQKRKRAIVIRSLPVWQRPRTPLVVGQHRKAGVLARARHRLRLLVSRNLGPPPAPSSASAFGGVLLTDLPLYELGLVDFSLYELSLKDGELYALALDDRVNYETSVKDDPLYETSLSDIPGG